MAKQLLCDILEGPGRLRMACAHYEPGGTAKLFVRLRSGQEILPQSFEVFVTIGESKDISRNSDRERFTIAGVTVSDIGTGVDLIKTGTPFKANYSLKRIKRLKGLMIISIP